MPLRVAYLVNVYPAVSHSFIRREIQALERAGVDVQRIALRGWQRALADPQDFAERERTAFVLRGGASALLGALLREALARPAKMLSAMRSAWRLSKGSDRSLPYHAIYLAEACVAAHWLRQRGTRHVHAHFGTNSTEVALLAATLVGGSYSFTVHGPDEFDRPRAIALGEKIRGAAFVVGISSYTRSQMFRWVEQEHWPKIHVVHCGLDAAFHVDEPAVAAPGNRFLCIGRLNEQKGQLLLLDALRHVLDRGHACELVLAGDGELRSALEARIAALGLQAQVRITGWIGSAEVRAELQAARALVLPSFAEGLPVVIMEAMALRRSVITTTVAGIPELVQDGATGWLVAPGDVEALADAMIACLSATPEALAAMGERARARVLRRHDVDIEAGRLVELFRNVTTAAAA